MTPEELAAFHREADEAANQTVSLAYATKRGEVTFSEIPFHILSSAVTLDPFGGRTPDEDEEELQGRAFDEGYSNRSLIRDMILSAVGDSSHKNRDKRFTKNQPLVITLIHGFGDPESDELEEVLGSASNLQRVIKYDESGQEVILDLIPLEVYCFFREENPSQSYSTGTGLPSWSPRGFHRSTLGVRGPSPHETTHLKFYIKHLEPVVPDKIDVIRTAEATSTGYQLIRALDTLTKIVHSGKEIDTYWKYARINFYPSLSALKGSQEIDDLKTEEIRINSVFSSKEYVDRLIMQDRAEGTSRSVKVLS